MTKEFIVRVTDSGWPDGIHRFEEEYAPEQELIRCRGCVKRPAEHKTELNGELYRYCELHRRWTTDDWFCADGERKEGR